MPRRKGRLYSKDAVAISKRLRKFADRFGARSEFAKRFGVPRTTLRKWIEDRDPAIPDAAYLLAMTEGGNLSLDWLFLGEGPELRQRATTTPRGAMMAAIDAELRATEMAGSADHEQAWARLAMYGPDAVFRLAVEAVRPIYKQALADVAYAQMSAHNLKQVYKALLLEMGRDVDDEKVRERFVELGTQAVAAQLKVAPRPIVFRPNVIEPA